MACCSFFAVLGYRRWPPSSAVCWH